MRRLLSALLVVVVSVLALPRLVAADPPLPVTVVSGLSGLPSSMALAPDGRVFLGLRNGSVRIIQNDALLADPVLTEVVDEGSHRGLLGIALHPNFASNGHLFAYLTCGTSNTSCAGSGGHNVVLRYTIAGNQAVAGSRIQVFDAGRASTPTNIGGALAFGSDGYLYLSVGDYCDPGGFGDECRRINNAPEAGDCPLLAATFGMAGWCNVWPSLIDDVRGKVLRVDPDAPSGCSYSGALCGAAPSTNPYSAPDGTLCGSALPPLPALATRLIYACGLRNVYGMALHPASTPSNQVLFAVDNGSVLQDELDRLEAGKTYGWPNFEGTANPLENPPPPDLAAYRAPLAGGVLDSGGITTLSVNRSSPALPINSLLTCQYMNGRLIGFEVVGPLFSSTTIIDLGEDTCRVAALDSGRGYLYWSRDSTVVREAAASRRTLILFRSLAFPAAGW